LLDYLFTALHCTALYCTALYCFVEAILGVEDVEAILGVEDVEAILGEKSLVVFRFSQNFLDK
jgi:hypothetical protein